MTACPPSPSPEAAASSAATSSPTSPTTGYRVIALDRAPDPASRAAAFVRVDLTDTGQVLEALTGVDDVHDGLDAVVHLAAIPAPGLTTNGATFANNIAATHNVFAAARRAGIRNVVWASSETVLGLPFGDRSDHDAPIKARRPTSRSTRSTRRGPNSTYSLVKTLEEEMARQFCRWDPALTMVGLRFSNVMDPDDYAQFPAFDADPRLRSWNLWGYIDGRDGAQAVRLALEHCAGGDGGVEVFVIANADTVMSPAQRRAGGGGLPRRPGDPCAGPARDAAVDREGAPAARLRAHPQLAGRRRRVGGRRQDAAALPPFVVSPGRLAVLLGLLFGLAGSSTSAVTVALPELARDLDVTPSTAAWMVSGYTVALAVATATHGRLADMVGIRLPLCLGVTAMAVGAVAAALSPSFPVLMVARVLQGVGAAAVPVLATALIAARVAGDAQAAALGRIAGVAATLSSLGPLAGGALEAVGGWRWAVALPAVGALALPLLWRAAPSDGSGERIDLRGATFVAMAATGLVLLIQSPAAGLVTAAVGGALLLVGVPATAVHVRARPDGFLPREIVTNGTVLRSAFATAAVPASWFALLLGVPLAAASWGWSPLRTGLLLVPSAVIGFLSPRVARTVIDRLGTAPGDRRRLPDRRHGAARRGPRGAAESPVLLSGAVALVTVAFGVGQPAMISSVGAAVPADRRGVALGVATLVFLVGASVGAALVGGLAEVVGVPVAFCLLVVLPVAGLATLLLGDRADPAAAT